MDSYPIQSILMDPFLIPASSRSGRITDAGPKVGEQLYRKTLGHDIRELVHRGNMEDANLAQGQLSIDPNGSFPNRYADLVENSLEGDGVQRCWSSTPGVRTTSNKISHNCRYSVELLLLDHP